MTLASQRRLGKKDLLNLTMCIQALVDEEGDNYLQCLAVWRRHMAGLRHDQETTATASYELYDAMGTPGNTMDYLRVI